MEIDSMSKINIVGLGYIGLPLALMFASHGAEVIGTDCKKELIEKLRAGQLSFEEKGLNELFEAAIAKGIRFTTEYAAAELYIIAVPTPYLPITKSIDPQYVISAVESVLRVAPKGAILVIESTISPGTIDRHIRPAVERAGLLCGRDIELVHAPERIFPGNMVYELENNSRTIGADNRETGEKVKAEYARFCRSGIVVTDIKTAEMTKVVENTYRDINIAFANELAKICRSDNLDVYEIIKIANMHPRVNILKPGPGVGGHCISVDPWFLVGDYPSLANVIRASRKVNDSMPEFVLRRISEIMKENGLSDTGRVGLYGITYKEDVDDTRESPTLQLLDSMAKHLAGGLKVYDPMIKQRLVEQQYFNFDRFLEDTDLIVVMVAHSHLRENLHRLDGKIIFDTRNVIDRQDVYKL